MKMVKRIPTLILEPLLDALTAGTFRGDQKWERFLDSQNGIYTTKEGVGVIWLGSPKPKDEIYGYQLLLYHSFEDMRSREMMYRSFLCDDSRLRQKVAELYELAVTLMVDKKQLLAIFEAVHT